ncbi:MAG TPA: hypothetical protein VFB32_09665 [Rudaea sp.]|nr:hypothetical protein [Rudaea sp.]
MANHGVCPKCGNRLLHVNIEMVMGMIDGDTKARCLSYSCIHCHTVLGVHLDSRSKARSKSARPPTPAKPLP